MIAGMVLRAVSRKATHGARGAPCAIGGLAGAAHPPGRSKPGRGSSGQRCAGRARVVALAASGGAGRAELCGTCGRLARRGGGGRAVEFCGHFFETRGRLKRRLRRAGWRRRNLRNLRRVSTSV